MPIVNDSSRIITTLNENSNSYFEMEFQKDIERILQMLTPERKALFAKLAAIIGPDLVYISIEQAQEIALNEIFWTYHDLNTITREETASAAIQNFAQKKITQEKDERAIEIYKHYVTERIPLPMYKQLTDEGLTQLIKNAKWYGVACPWVFATKEYSLYNAILECANVDDETFDYFKWINVQPWLEYKLPAIVVSFFADKKIAQTTKSKLFNQLKQFIADSVPDKLEESQQPVKDTILSVDFADIEPYYRSHHKELEKPTEAELAGSDPWAVPTAITGLILHNALLRAKNIGDLENLKAGSQSAEIRAAIQSEETTDKRTKKPLIRNYFLLEYKTRGKKYTDIQIVIDEVIKLNAHAETVAQFWLWLLVCLNDVRYNKGDYIGFNLQDLVDNGMYTHIESARTGYKTAAAVLSSVRFVGSACWDGRKKLTQTSIASLFNGFEKTKENYCKVYINKRMNWDFFKQFFNFLPSDIFTLKGRKQAALYYLSFEARRHKKLVAQGKPFTISLKQLQPWLYLPQIEDCKGFPGRLIKKPIIQIFTEDLADLPDYSITLVADEDAATTEFLNKGYISVLVKNPKIIETMNQLATEQAKQIEANIKRKEKGIAEGIARATEKAAKIGK